MPVKCMLKDIILTQILKAKSPCCLYGVSFLDPIWILLHPIPGESPSRPGGSQQTDVWLCALVGRPPPWGLQTCVEAGVPGPKHLLCSNRLSLKGTLQDWGFLPSGLFPWYVCLVFCFFAFFFFFFDAVHENLQTLTQASSFFSLTF